QISLLKTVSASAITIVMLSLAGCGSSLTQMGLPRSGSSSFAKRSATPSPQVYVAYCSGSRRRIHGKGTLAAYPLFSKRGVQTVPLGACESGGVLAPYNLAIDTSHNVYVAIQNGNAVEVYAPGKVTPMRIIRITAPGKLTFDSSGNLYVAS